MKRRHAVLALAFVSCAVSLIFTDWPASDEIVEAMPRARATATAAAQEKASPPPVGIAALRSRKALFGSGGGGRRDLFVGQALAAPLPSAAPALAQVPPLPPAPAAPSVPFVYIGKEVTGGVWEVYLARGQETLIVQEHTVIDAMYRVESITPPTLTLVYLPLKLVQTLDVGSAN